MAITIIPGPITQANITLVRNEINRLRTKHSLATTTFTADTGFAINTVMNDLKAKITGIDASGWIVDGSINVTSIPTFSTTTQINLTDLTSMGTVLNTVDAICAHNANYSDYPSNYSNYSNYPSDYSNYSNYPSNYSANYTSNYSSNLTNRSNMSGYMGAV